MRHTQRQGTKPQQNPSQIQKHLLDYFDSRFGLDQFVFCDFGFYMGSKNRVYLGPKQLISQPKIVSLGIMIARIEGNIKPTTNFFQIFGRHVKRNFIDLTKEQTVSYIRGDDLQVACNGASDGYVLLRSNNVPLGCGLLKGKILKNMMPKAKRLRLDYL